MNVAYCGPLFDYSGYGEANRHAAAALHIAGVNVIAQSVRYTTEPSDFGSLGQVVEALTHNTGDYGIKIIHTTPNEYKRYMEPGKYHIGHFFWETDTVPEDFKKGLELMDEIWTGSEANADAIRKAVPDAIIRIYPQAIETVRDFSMDPYELPDFDGHLFYSIFEWTDRKNPLGLLDAYYREFQKGENVGLLIKTYFKNFDYVNKRMIRDQIAEFKLQSGLEKFPRVFLFTDLMDRHHISRLHVTGDTYVSPHRGEGWGLPIVEAALAGNPVIATGYGGAPEWMMKANAGYILDYDMVPIKGMEHSARWYSRDQKWAEPNVAQLRNSLRAAYEGRDTAKMFAQRGQDLVREQFSLMAVGEEMAGRLSRIEQAFEKARPR